MRRFLATLAIPLTTSTGWQNLRFNGIPPNHVRHESGGLTIFVDKSSSPLIYPLPEAFLTKSAQAELEIEGELPAGTKFPDDAYFRLGLVVPSGRRLSFMDRMLAATWVKPLFALAPGGVGIEKVYFYELIANPKFVNQTRELPKAKGLMEETAIAVRSVGQREVHFEATLAEAKKVAALWIGVDGDDTLAKFTVRIKSLILRSEN